MKILSSIVAIIVLSGCASKYKPPANNIPSANIVFELMTPSGPGGGTLLVGTEQRCKASKMVSGIMLGHTFMSDKNIVETKVKVGTPITLRAQIADTILYTCDSTLVFTPEAGKSYYSTFEYHLPGCKIEVFEGTKQDKSVIDYSMCN
jgi:hypothetical protein